MSPISSLIRTNTIITVASWEERFLLGTTKLVDTISPAKILMFHYDGVFAEWSKENRDTITALCSDKGIELVSDKILSFSSPSNSWKLLLSEVAAEVSRKELVTLDISTMPRETIWTICHALKHNNSTIQFINNKPRSENGYGEWLSRDPGRPRILYRQAGIQYIGRKTALFIQSGFDVDRTKQLVRYFEPDIVLLGLQTGEQFENVIQNRQKHENAFAKRHNVEMFDVDGYSLEDCFNTFETQIQRFTGEYNIIISSLGPKIGALALYKLKQCHPDIALCYAPSNEYNHDYSRGIGDCIYGILHPVC